MDNETLIPAGARNPGAALDLRGRRRKRKPQSTPPPHAATPSPTQGQVDRIRELYDLGPDVSDAAVLQFWETKRNETDAERAQIEHERAIFTHQAEIMGPGLWNKARRLWFNTILHEDAIFNDAPTPAPPSQPPWWPHVPAP